MSFFDLQNKHECVLIGNIWDSLSTLIMEQCGFHALGTTSWGIANTLGYNDGEQICFTDYFSIITKIKSITNLPISVDIESGFSDNEIQILENILRLADIGCLGINIEDTNQKVLKDSNDHAQLIHKIRIHLDKNGYSNFFINARTDTYIQLSLPLEETIIRAKAYEGAGANGVFIPCLKNSDQIRKISQSIEIPLNIMSLPDCTNIKELKENGVRRFSFGNAMSDCIISYIEELCHSIQLEQSTDKLYKHSLIGIEFKDKE